MATQRPAKPSTPVRFRSSPLDCPGPARLDGTQCCHNGGTYADHTRRRGPPPRQASRGRAGDLLRGVCAQSVGPLSRGARQARRPQRDLRPVRLRWGRHRAREGPLCRCGGSRWAAQRSVTLFVYTSAFYAAADSADRSHGRATEVLTAASSLITSDHVLVESWTLILSTWWWCFRGAFLERRTRWPGDGRDGLTRRPRRRMADR